MRERLGPELINRVIQVAVQLEFYDRRQVLLLQIPRDFQSTMPMARGERMRDQLVSDLNYLNEAGILSDGSDPLRTWLNNAIDAAGGVQEEAVFQRPSPNSTSRRGIPVQDRESLPGPPSGPSGLWIRSSTRSPAAARGFLRG